MGTGWLRGVMAAFLLVLVSACSNGEATGANKGQGQHSEAGAANATARPRPAIPADAPVILAFGDSLYAGYGLRQDQGLVPTLESALAAAGHPAHVVNGGVSGDTTAAGRARLAFTLDGLPQKPALVLVGLGGNDMLRGISPAQTRANLEAIVSALDQRHIPVMLTGMLASPNLGAEYTAAFNPIYPALARAHHAALYPFYFDGVVGNAALFQADGLHPNQAGVEIIVSKLAPAVVKALDQ